MYQHTKIVIGVTLFTFVNPSHVLHLYDNAKPHISCQTHEKIRELGWMPLIHPPYSPDLTPTVNHFLSVIRAFPAWNMLHRGNLRSTCIQNLYKKLLGYKFFLNFKISFFLKFFIDIFVKQKKDDNETKI
jgi:hypothetical protein